MAWIATPASVEADGGEADAVDLLAEQQRPPARADQRVDVVAEAGFQQAVGGHRPV